MPEWKSWTFESDEDALVAVPALASPAPGRPGGPEAAPSVEMAPDAAAEKWGTEVCPVTIERIEAVVAGDGLPHASAEFIVLTEIEGLRIQVHREPADAPWLQVECRLDLPETARELPPERLNAIANAWNLDHLQPTVFPVEAESGSALVLATRFFVAEGLSDRQIHAVLRRGISVALQARTELPALFGGE